MDSTIDLSMPETRRIPIVPAQQQNYIPSQYEHSYYTPRNMTETQHAMLKDALGKTREGMNIDRQNAESGNCL